MAQVHRFEKIQSIPVNRERAWAFFSDPGNLPALTPPFLNLKMTNQKNGSEIYPGQIITYNVKPLLGISVFWMTEITHVIPLKLFVDEQRIGPYSIWHHEHHFTVIENGVKMTDIVHYRLPLAFISNLASKIVENKLNKIFEYRFQKVNEIFKSPK